MRQSQNLEARHEALSLPGSAGLGGGAYQADFVEQVSQAETDSGARQDLEEQIED